MVAVALIDGPLDGPDTPARRHARAMAAAIGANCGAAEITAYPVFGGGLSTSAAKVARALAQAAQDGPQIVLCALGLPRADAGIVAALDRLIGAGAAVVAARPARGAAEIWPAAHPPVFAVQGDARCGPAQHSALGPGRWFGACPVGAADPEVAGASAAAAHFAGLLAQALAQGAAPADLARRMEAGAAWTGRERRLA